MSTGKRLKKIRDDKGFSQEEFAEAINVSDRTIRNYENSEEFGSLILNICQVLEITPNYLFGFNENTFQDTKTIPTLKKPF